MMLEIADIDLEGKRKTGCCIYCMNKSNRLKDRYKNKDQEKMHEKV